MRLRLAYRLSRSAGTDRSRMMSITTKSPYAVRALVELHRQFGRCSTAELSHVTRPDVSARSWGSYAQGARCFSPPTRSAPGCSSSTASPVGHPSPPAGSKVATASRRPATDADSVLEVVEVLDGPRASRSRRWTSFAQAASAARSVVKRRSAGGRRGRGQGARSSMYQI